MIISHKYKFIFIKTTKTAGTSVEVDLNKVLGPVDVATPIYPPVDGHLAKNYILKRSGDTEFEFYNHISALEVLKQLGQKTFRDYFVFCIEREPVDKCISHFSMLKNSPFHRKDIKNMTMNEYIDRAQFPIDVEKYTDENGALIADRILPYENLAQELRGVGKMLGFDVSLRAQAKTGFRENVRLTDGQIAVIYDAFASSNRHTGYSA